MITRVCPNPECPDIELFGLQGEYLEPVDVCPKCGAKLVIAPRPVSPADDGLDVELTAGSVPPELPNDPGDLVPLCTVATATELAVVESLLIEARVFYFVHNRHFSACVSGPVIPLYNVRTVFVPESQLEIAREVIATVESEPWRGTEFQAGDRFRVLVELLMFGWVMPHHRHRPGGRNDA